MQTDLIETAVAAITFALLVGAAHMIYRAHLKRKDRLGQDAVSLHEAPEDVKQDIEEYRARRRKELGLD